MSFQIKILLLSFAVSTIISLIVIPILRKLKVGQSEREDGPKSHLKKKGTPTMGGIILIITIVLLSAFLYIDYATDEPEIATRLLPMVFVTIGFGLIGFIDDFKKVVLHNTDGLSPKLKMLGLLIIAIAYVVMLVFNFENGTDIYIPFVHQYITLPLWIYIPFSHNKCSKLNRWHRRIVNKCYNNNSYMLNCNFNNMGCKRNNNIWMYNNRSRIRFLTI